LDSRAGREIWDRRERTLANQVGKRYTCEKCGSGMIVTKAGEGELACCGQPMKQQ
jgi:desulfoferrodoxin-like iron-binding protein